VPVEAVGFVTGKNGNFLRTLEDEWSVLMLFAEFDRSANRKFEELAIFGDRRGRRGAELKALSAIEAKCEGFFETRRDVILHREDDDDWGTSTMEFKPSELAYALGKNGATRRKIEASSGCITQYIGLTGIFAGTRAERQRAKAYTEWLFEQSDTNNITIEWETREDCTVLDIPQDCVGYVTGCKRCALGQIEEEFGVLMFFMGPKDTQRKSEKLIIFGFPRGRIGASLKVKSTVEAKACGFYTKGLRNRERKTRKLAVDVMYLKDKEISYALGARGSTRKKLQDASGCIIQYIANYAHLAGLKNERQRGREYLNFLLEQRHGGKVRMDVRGREDCTKMDIPRGATLELTRDKGSGLRRIEERTKTFCFLAQDLNGEQQMLCFGKLNGSRALVTGRAGAEALINDLINDRDRRRSRRGRHSRSASRRQRRSRSAVRGRRSVIPRRRSFTPMGRKSFTPRGRKSFTPRGRKSFTPRGRRSMTPLGRKSYISRGRRSPTPIGRKSPTPFGRRSFTPRGRRSPTPIGRKSPTPFGRKSFTPRGRRSPTPIGRKSPTPFGRKSFPPRGRKSFSPRGRRSPTPKGRRSPTPRAKRSRTPVRVRPSLTPRVQSSLPRRIGRKR